jgi:protein involved in polysaccharide export with SLBB domain
MHTKAAMSTVAKRTGVSRLCVGVAGYTPASKISVLRASIKNLLLIFIASTFFLGVSSEATSAADASDVPEYRLGFGDVIEVKFFNNERFNETVTVRPDGRMALQRMGEFFVSGMTPRELDSLITVRYAEFIQQPDVTIFLREFGGYQVYVLGEVNTAGGYPVQRDMTVLQAIAAAGGMRDGGKLASVVIIRQKETGEIDAFKVNLKEAVKRDEEAVRDQNIYVQPLDIVFVPKTFVANMSTFMTQVYAGFFPPVQLYLQALFIDRAVE